MEDIPKDEGSSSDWNWCYEMLTKTSRSFAAVIQTLGEELKDSVCIFYLTLRALDTIEDDTRFPKERKIPLLNDFYKKLRQRGWNFNECGEGNERYLLSNLDRMIKCHLELKQSFREIIEDITRRMGKGMSEFIEREVVSIADWDLYCHYVAGLVGIGLSRLFAESGLEVNSSIWIIFPTLWVFVCKKPT
jgi:farnesyl-diphosphate farnesyltransferase